jgi:hypothetical protein
MRPRRVIARLYDPLARRFGAARFRFRVSAGSKWDRQTDALVTFSAIEMHSAWVQFARSYFLSCAIGAMRANGQHVLHNLTMIKSADDALREAVYHMRPSIRGKARWKPRDEPNWMARRTLIELAKHFGFSHTIELSGALSLQTRVFDDLPPLRNFFAHRSRDTFAVALGVASAYQLAGLHPSRFVVSRAPGRPDVVGEEWLDDLLDTAAAICAA